MPPKIKPTLQLNVSQSPQDSFQGQLNPSSMLGSIRTDQADEVTVISKSFNPYSFTTEGMRRNNGQHYKISERDIWIIKRQGSGASSVVYKGFYVRENKFVAVKKINVLDRDTRHQMMNDVKALCDSKSAPGLVSFYGAYHMPDVGQIAIVLDYMDGGSLLDLIQKVGKIPENILSRISGRILQGLVYLHKQKHMVHRDIKPGNILLNSEGEPKITDFGISAFINSTLAVCNTYLGTVTYMSPERIRNEQYSFSADIWSLGLVLIECILGRYPYDGKLGPLDLMLHVLEEPVPIPQDASLSSEFKDFLQACLQKDASERPTAEQLLAHPYIRKYAQDPTASLREYMKLAFDPHDKLDEITIIFTWNYYALFSAGPTEMQALAPLYSDSSVLSHEGRAFTGRQSITAALGSVAQEYAAKSLKHQIERVDCQPLGMDGSALVLVYGRLIPGKPGVVDGPLVYSESFILCQVQPGEYYVANQLYRVLKG